MSETPKTVPLTPAIHHYLVEHGTPPDAVLQELIEETKKIGELSAMQIAPEQGAFMTFLARLMGAKRAIELGTFTGYSALCLARGLGKEGYLLCCDVSEQWTAVARHFWEKAGVSETTDLRIGAALETLQALPEKRNFDMAFIDADKKNQNLYYEELLKRIRPGGLILVDNVLLSGRVADANNSQASVEAVREFNQQVAHDPRVDCVMLPIADGLTLLRVH